MIYDIIHHQYTVGDHGNTGLVLKRDTVLGCSGTGGKVWGGGVVRMSGEKIETNLPHGPQWSFSVME